MAFNPIAYRAQVLAQGKPRQGLPAPDALSGSPESLHLQLSELDKDVTYLSSLENRADRQVRKRDVLLPKWRPYVERYLAGDEVYENTVFAWCIIWSFDVGDFDTGLNWADIAIAQSQPTPARFKNTFARFVADTVLEWAEQEAEYGHSIEPYFSRVFGYVTNTWRLHEEITAKWYKFAGSQLLRDSRGRMSPASALNDTDVLQAADALLAKAHECYPRVGVKTLRDKIAQRLRALSQ